MATWRLQWTCWQPTPYNDVFFEALSRDPSFDLTVHFRASSVDSHPWKTSVRREFRWRLFQRRLGVDWHLLRLALDARNVFVVAGWDDPASIALLNLLMARAGPFVLWTDTPNLNARRTILKQKLRSAWLERVFDRASAVMTTGQPAMAPLVAMGCPAAKLRNLPYSVDLDSFKQCSRQTPRQRMAFVSCGRLHPDKGYDLALRALARVYGPASTDRFLYRIAGAGPDSQRLRALTAELGISSSVEFVDWLEPADLPGFYSGADILLHPARLEPYGVAVLEAMASGVVVIGSRVTAAVADRIVDGVNGFVHAANDWMNLAESISSAVSDPARLEAIKRAARRTAEEWPVSRAVETVKDVCAGVVGSTTRLTA